MDIIAQQLCLSTSDRLLKDFQNPWLAVSSCVKQLKDQQITTY